MNRIDLERDPQLSFDLGIGQLDNMLSRLVLAAKHEIVLSNESNKQTLKHHAEDMILAGRKILKDLGYESI